MVRARNRKFVAPDGPEAVRSDRFPSTERRVRRLESVIEKRQPTLTVVLEDVFDPHNASAVLRSCDAVGIQEVHLVYVKQVPPRKSFGKSSSASAAKWLDVRFHESIEACYAHLRERDFRILATALQEESREIYEEDFTKPTALVFGNEKDGVSDEGIALADGSVYIPMQGMVESLNISVSCAVSLYEAMRQRRAAGMYSTPQIEADAREQLLADWVER